ncbi:rhamnosyltransferase [Candidatus Hakubella thermalkaliphila]|uniref:Rhamnosyltransferase n=1 Tax=Candidatus Hakubella thermalkaliphila TaxID=2754717 RepID=A0A6V8QFK7_9ACTN|nr:rhamnosyltransferase [Candidatus Hakubella thermalkaliphila]GFP43523.1 rhamnosyltransferase [Candidatus Hakubella thermalkaliphila]
MEKEVAILISNYNGKHFLEYCLPSVLDQSGADFDVFLIDNASSDGSADFVRENFPQINIIQNKENLGFAEGNNVGIRKVIDRYPYIAFLNNDTKVNKDWLKELLKSIDRSSEIGISTSVILDSQGQMIQGAGGYFASVVTGTNAGAFHNQEYRDFDLTKDFPVFWASGCSFLVKSQILREIGLFDENYFSYYEDIDLSWRTLMHGYRITCSVGSCVCHYGSGTWKGRPPSFYLAERNRLLTYFKNLSCFNLLWILPILLLARLVFAVLFFDSLAHFVAKLRGILSALLWIPRYLPKRKNIQRLRRVGDQEVFRNNLVMFPLKNHLR